MNTTTPLLLRRVGTLTVSTVYAAGGVEPPTGGREPRRYETLVYDETAETNPVPYDGERYHTERAARDGHDRFVKRALWGEFR